MRHQYCYLLWPADIRAVGNRLEPTRDSRVGVGLGHEYARHDGCSVSCRPHRTKTAALRRCWWHAGFAACARVHVRPSGKGNARDRCRSGSVPDDLYRLLRREHGTDCMDPGGRGVPASITEPGGGGGNAWLWHLQYACVTELPQRNPSHRECLDLRRLCALLRDHIALYTIHRSGNKSARIGEYQRVIAALTTI